ncbi:DUF1499 domain-containing protein [Roseovarius sp. A21]|uniref:DUF1499 domain-containing protein n=1 Tax=Roseovarius bejariae TaxID=2576383 RepID=A0A844CPX1_9RHOB|nr:DUF1499 domain-containing protein [Roseovarius bejariae]MRU16897.1 DUF1499 domain-containing protein [Roseovarius bejariae]
MKWLVLGMVGLVVAVAVYVRLAPTDPAQWHEMPGAVTNRDLTGGAMRVVGAGEGGLAWMDEIIRATPRTEVLAGSVESGMVTYVTRSRVFGFPDYTTLRASGPQLELYGRSRFGRSDFGVNAARLDRWLKAFAERG